MFTIFYDNIIYIFKLFELTKSYDSGSACLKTLKRNKSEAKLKRFDYDSEQDATAKFHDYKDHLEDNYAKQRNANAKMSHFIFISFCIFFFKNTIFRTITEIHIFMIQSVWNKIK